MLRFLSSALSIGLLALATYGLFAASGSGSAKDLEGSDKVDFLLERLESSPNFKVRIAAAEALGKVANGTVADWMLRAFRKENNDAVRLATLYAVGQIPEALIVPPLLELSTQELLGEQEIIALERIIWNFRRAVAVSEWTKVLLDSSKHEERALAAYLIGMVANVSSLTALIAALSDPAPTVRMRAVQAIGRIGSTEGKPFCQALRKTDREPTVAKAAATCVGEIELVFAHRVPRENARRIDLKIDLAGLQPNAVTPALMRAYLSKNVNPRKLERVVAQLRKEKPEAREDKTIRLVWDEAIRKTIRVNAEIVTLHNFPMFSLSRLREAVREQAGIIDQCYLTALKSNPKLGGAVSSQFLILNDGSVATVESVRATLQDPKGQSCIVDRLRAIRFPQIPFKYVTMKYDFSFTPPREEKYEFEETPAPASSGQEPGAED
ncbi:MAG: HEAT repeat domain-containing protein [Pseudomonadota bacterium]